jgi:hypothetical protein
VCLAPGGTLGSPSYSLAKALAQQMRKCGKQAGLGKDEAQRTCCARWDKHDEASAKVRCKLKLDTIDTCAPFTGMQLAKDAHGRGLQDTALQRCGAICVAAQALHNNLQATRPKRRTVL